LIGQRAGLLYSELDQADTLAQAQNSRGVPSR
jgi:hypothetical protein